MNQPYYVLEVRYGDGTTETHEVSEEKRILGRSKVKADLQITDKKASGRHAEIKFVGGTVTVRDMGSTNGTMHNGQKAEQFALGPGNSFRVGDTTIRLMAIHGIEEEESAKTIVSAPAWVDDEDEATRALSAAQIALVTGQEPPSVDDVPAPIPVPQPVAPPGRSVPQAPVPARPAPTPMIQPPEPMAYPEEEEEDSTAQGDPPEWAVEAARAPAEPQKAVAIPQEGWGAPGGSAGMAAGPVHMEFEATAGQLFKKVFLGYLACLFTVFIYFPWFLVGMKKWFYSHLQISTNRGDLVVNFNGTGGRLLLKLWLGGLLCIVTLFIYVPWHIVSLKKWFLEHTSVTDHDGNVYELELGVTGGQYFKFVLINGLLTLLTAGIWGAWFWCRTQNLWLSATTIKNEDQPIGTVEFTGKGGKLLLMVFVNYLLTLVTLGFYFPWFRVKLYKFKAQNTRLVVNGRAWAGTFAGKGLALLKLSLKGFFLTIITLTVYAWWFAVQRIAFEIDNSGYEEV